MRYDETIISQHDTVRCGAVRCGAVRCGAVLSIFFSNPMVGHGGHGAMYVCESLFERYGAVRCGSENLIDQKNKSAPPNPLNEILQQC